MKPLLDDELARRILDGDEGAFSTLVERYHVRLVRLARGFVQDASIAEEVAQETWVGVLVGLPSFENRCALKTWIFRIAVNRARTRGVREARSTPFSALGDDDDGGPLDAIVDAARLNGRGMWAHPPRAWQLDTPEALVGRAELIAAVESATDRLPPRQRSAILLRDVEDLDTSEICELLGVTDGHLRILLHRARGAIRRALEAQMEVVP